MNATLNHRQVLSALSVLCLSVLGACGGGYGGGGSSSMSTCGGAYGGSCTPTVTVTNTAGSVSGMVTLTASAKAQGTYTVASVQFRVDGNAVGAADTSAPYSTVWDSSTVANGTHLITAVVTDSANQTAISAAITLTVTNAMSLAVKLGAEQLFPQPTTTATGMGNFTVEAKTGQFGGRIALTGMTASGAEIGDAYAGAQGAAVISLSVNAENAGQWEIPAGTMLNAQQLADLGAGKFYVLVRSAQHPNGELRAQLLPDGILVRFAALTGAAEVPHVASTATGQVAVTVDISNQRAAAHVNVAGLAPTGSELDSGAAGAVGSYLATLAVDANDAHHFFNEAITLTGADMTELSTGLWYGNVSTVAHTAGELRGQIGRASPESQTELSALVLGER